MIELENISDDDFEKMLKGIYSEKDYDEMADAINKTYPDDEGDGPDMSLDTTDDGKADTEIEKADTDGDGTIDTVVQHTEISDEDPEFESMIADILSDADEALDTKTNDMSRVTPSNHILKALQRRM